ncbi:alpha/beta hydrolase [Phormidium yuhuli AB48]|uniref:Alpha/beta hydrolase n=1 Tax=Phormidium yuhuli AB48 TaxID=2940671 RepID=A0ABY5ANC8_9CYAN|nr:alpha/beta hydrolase [Phormidium yuhuli]USR90451.1 alpha/beta hydrolase [Phormidium yuhuli AB48]
MSVVPWLLAILSGLGLLLSLAIVVPAPTMFLLVFTVVAPEISPWLVGFHAIALLLLARLSLTGGVAIAILICSLLGLSLSLLPLLQVPATVARFNAEMERGLGSAYLKSVPEPNHQFMRRQPLQLLDVFRGIPLPSVRIQREIPFAEPDGVSLTLNLYRPPTAGQYPTVIIIYGGAWRQGTPNNDEWFSRYLASRGYTVVAIDYRHAPKYQFPAQLEDVKTAIGVVCDRAEELGVDGDRIALMGRSAGGHLAMLAAYDPEEIPIRGLINYYAPVNLTQGYYDLPNPDPLEIQNILRDFLGGTPEELPDLYDRASPWHLVAPNLPPSLLIYGQRDHIVQAKFGQQLQEKLLKSGNRSVFLEIPWAEHSFDAIYFGISNQLALYYTERFLYHILSKP